MKQAEEQRPFPQSTAHEAQREHVGTFTARLYWFHAWGVYECLRPFLGRDLGQAHKDTEGKESYR